MGLIVILHGRTTKKPWFTGEARLGRSAPDSRYPLRAWIKEGDKEREEDLGIHDWQISRRHARVDARGEKALVQDLGSKYHTYINGKEIPWAGEGKPGEPVPLPLGRSQLRLGPQSAIEIEVLTSPLGLRPDWGADERSLERMRQWSEMQQDLEFRWKKLEQQLEKERLDYLRHFSIEILMLLARDQAQVEGLYQMGRLNTLASLPDEKAAVLALADKAVTAEVAREILLAVHQSGRTDQYEQLMVEWLESQKIGQEAQERNMQRMADFFKEVLGTIATISGKDSPPPPPVRFCPNCRTEVAPSYKFCPNCRAPL